MSFLQRLAVVTASADYYNVSKMSVAMANCWSTALFLADLTEDEWNVSLVSKIVIPLKNAPNCSPGILVAVYSSTRTTIEHLSLIVSIDDKLYILERAGLQGVIHFFELDATLKKKLEKSERIQLKETSLTEETFENPDVQILLKRLYNLVNSEQFRSRNDGFVWKTPTSYYKDL